MRSASHLLAQQASAHSASTKQGRIALLEFLTIDYFPLNQAKEWLDLVNSLNASEIEELTLHMEERGVNFLNQAQYEMLLIAWARLEPALALEHYIDKKIRNEVVRQSMLAEWATEDPLAAMQWANGKSEKNQDNSWIRSLFRGVAGRDLELATKLISEMPDSYDRSNALLAIKDDAIKQEPEAARKWATSFEDDKLRASSIRMVAWAQAETDSKSAADWLLSHPDESVKSAIKGIMSRMSEADPQGAIDYMNQINETSTKSHALAGIANWMAHDNPQAAITLIDSYPDLNIDHAMLAVVRTASKEEPLLVANSIARIRDEKCRNLAYSRCLPSWLTRDYEAALNWINQNDLPEEVRASMEKTIKRMESKRH